MIDLVVVDPVTWLPIGAPLSYYNSLIWTERFLEDSDMVLKTYDVKRTMELLPLMSLVSIRQSKELIIVENHSIETDENDVEFLTVTGRSLTSYLHHRVIGEKRNVKYQAMNSSPLGSGLILLYNSFVNDQAWDLTTGTSAYYKNPNDAIPNCVITDSTGEIAAGTSGPSEQRWLEPGTIDGPIRNFFREKPYGLRALRPKNSTNKITVAQNQVISSTFVTNIPQLCIDVFTGVNRSADQTVNPPVIFDTEIDDLINPNYLYSVGGLKTEVHIALNDQAVFARRSDYSGLGRRVLFLDGGDPEEGFDPSQWDDYNIRVAQALLASRGQMSIVDGAVSPQSKVRYGVDYNLGDLVSVRGRYGLINKARVTEYIRAYDAGTGYTNYPTLINV